MRLKGSAIYIWYMFMQMTLKLVNEVYICNPAIQPHSLPYFAKCVP